MYELNNDYKQKLKNRLFGLLCEYEKGREWEKFLDGITIEILGIPKDLQGSAYNHLLHNLAACKYLSYGYFRSTIFDCMNLVDRL